MPGRGAGICSLLGQASSSFPGPGRSQGLRGRREGAEPPKPWQPSPLCEPTICSGKSTFSFSPSCILLIPPARCQHSRFPSASPWDLFSCPMPGLLHPGTFTPRERLKWSFKFLLLFLSPSRAASCSSAAIGDWSQCCLHTQRALGRSNCSPDCDKGHI